MDFPAYNGGVLALLSSDKLRAVGFPVQSSSFRFVGSYVSLYLGPEIHKSLICVCSSIK